MSRASLSLVTPPALFPLTLDEARTHVRQDVSDDDVWLSDAIAAATELIEAQTGRQLIAATSRLVLDAWPSCGWIDIPAPPLIGITSVAYVDSAGDTQTWASSNYRVSAPAGPRCARGRLSLASGISWPTTLAVADAITITLTHGYGASALSVPLALKQAMRMLIAHWYDQRSAVVMGSISKPIELAFAALIAPYKTRAEQ